MSKEQYHSDAFITQWLSGSLTPEENQVFNFWLQAHPEEQLYFQDIKLIWQLTGNLHAPKDKTANERWQLLEQTIEETTQPKQRGFVVKVLQRLALPAAAALFLFFIYQFYLDQKSEVVITALAHKQTITLPDSSVVQLNTGGTIRYKERSWKRTRSVTLNGEAFFDVRKNNVPFIVHTGFSNTKVMGTSFNISAIADSVQVACFSGKVAITNTQLNTPIVYLTAGWGSTVKKAYAPSAPAPIDSNLISWSTGILSFQATPLNQVIAQLTKHYGVRIYLKNKGLRTFTGIFDQKSLKEIIEIICLANNLSFSGSSQEGYIIF